MPISKTSTPKTHTGNIEFDANRLDVKGEDAKKPKEQKGDFMSYVGDSVEWIGKTILSPDMGLFLGYLGAGYCLILSGSAWSVITGNPLVGAGLALGEQYIELLPRLSRYFPDIADKLTFKLAQTRFIETEVKDSNPTLLSEVKDQAREAHKTRQRLMETSSIVCYIGAFLASAMAFQLFDPVNWTLRPQGVFDVVLSVIGFEICMIFCEWMKGQRLTSRQSRQFNQIKHRQRLAAEQALHAANK